MISGKTASGFEYTIDDNVGDDYELLELMGDVRNGDTLAIFQLISKILGKEQHQALKEHCRVDGRVSTAKMNEEIIDIFAASKDVKNS